MKNIKEIGDFIQPGDKNGTISRKIMAFLEEEIMPIADFIMDLHSGSSMEQMASCLFFPVGASDEVAKISMGAASNIAIEHLIASRSSDGFYSYAASKGIPGILVERGYNNTCEKEDYEGFIQDIYLLLDHFNVLEITHRPEEVERIVWMKTDYIEAQQTGVWFPRIEPGMFVKKAAEFKSTVEVIAKGKTVNAKSIMGIMSLGLGQGDELTVVANGEDQEAAVNALVELIEGGFGE